MAVALAVVAHDPQDVLLDKLRSLLPDVVTVFDGGIGVRASVDASDASLEVYRSFGAVVEQETMSAGTETIGRRRRGALETALRTGAAALLFSDVDHVLRWVEREPDDLRRVLALLGDADLTVVGRPPELFEEAPGPLRETERLCNAFYERLTGRAWELFIAVRGMSAATARLIVDGCAEDTIGNDVAWPLFVESRGCSMQYTEARLPYENHTWFASGVSERSQLEADPLAWAFRARLAAVMFDAFARWGPQASR